MWLLRSPAQSVLALFQSVRATSVPMKIDVTHQTPVRSDLVRFHFKGRFKQSSVPAVEFNGERLSSLLLREEGAVCFIWAWANDGAWGRRGCVRPLEWRYCRC